MRALIGVVAVFLAAVSITTRAEAQYRPPRIIIRPQPAPPPSPAGKRYVAMDYPSPEKRAANLAAMLDLADEQRPGMPPGDVDRQVREGLELGSGFQP